MVPNVVVVEREKRKLSDTKRKPATPSLSLSVAGIPRKGSTAKGELYCKGSALLPFDKKGTRKMKRKDLREHTRHSFDSYCKKITKHGAFDRYRIIRRRKASEVPFSELTENETASLATKDRYFTDEYAFDILGERVGVSDGELAEALRELPAGSRAIVLMSYFFDMKDREIAVWLRVARRTVAHYRALALKEMRDYLESED
jgi:DNA-directed RNA polymerase specialized sigma24 family protein